MRVTPGSPSIPTSPTSPTSHRPGSDLRQRVESLGTALGDSLRSVLASRGLRPQKLADALGITTVTASRLLKALSQSDPIVLLQSLPGPNPLKKVIAAAQAKGSPPSECATALGFAERFDQLIRTEAGDRRAFEAMLSAWLPNERRDFEAQRRQSIYKATAELDGVSAALELDTILLHPGADARRIDLVNLKCLLGIDRMRPDAPVRFGTRRLHGEEGPEPARRCTPMNLDGEPAWDGLHTVRLDEFCEAPPAPLEVHRFGFDVTYSLGPTGFGPASKVDLVIAELNRGELERREPSREHPPYFWVIPEMAARRLVFDLIVHRDIYPGCDPELIGYETTTRGAAIACDPVRHLDVRPVIDTIQHIGPGTDRLRLLEYARYGELQTRVFEKLGWNRQDFRAYRIDISHPLKGLQICMAFKNSPPTRQHGPVD